MIVWAAALVLLCLCRYSYAGDRGTSDDKAKAQSFFEQGEALFTAGDYSDAAAAFLNAYNTLPHYTVLANIGVSYERAQNYPAAVKYLRQYLDALDQANGQNPNMDALLAKTLAKVATLTVSADGFCSACEVCIDNVYCNAGTIERVVNPGRHEIRLLDKGEVRVTEKLTVSAGEHRNFTFARVETGVRRDPPQKKEPVVAVPPQTPAKKRPSGLPVKVLLGVAAGAGITSVVLWGATASTKKQFDSKKTNQNAEIADELLSLQERGVRLQAGAWVATVITGAAAVASAVVAITRERTSKKDRTGAVSVNVSVNAANLSVRF